MTKERLFIFFKGKAYRYDSQQFTDEGCVTVYLKEAKQIREAKTMTTRHIHCVIIHGGSK